jgi:hypothetical protein
MPTADPAYHHLFEAHLARWSPADAAERHWVEELAFAAWRLRKVGEQEAALLTAEPEPGTPAALVLLARYRQRIERDLRLAETQLLSLRETRPQLPANLPANPARLRWLAERAEAAEHAARDAGEPDGAATQSNPWTPAIEVTRPPHPTLHDRSPPVAAANGAAG